jgi:hypothetical protein
VYAGETDTRTSVYGYILFFCGAPIARKYKAGKSVTLSSTEVEYYATSEIAKDSIFCKESTRGKFNYNSPSTSSVII